LFDAPQTIQTIRVVFKEEEIVRTQEFVLRWLPYGAGSRKDIVRQHWNFSPPNAVDEHEEYKSNCRPPLLALSQAILELASDGPTESWAARGQVDV
jgi:hypothetical protein